MGRKKENRLLVEIQSDSSPRIWWSVTLEATWPRWRAHYREDAGKTTEHEPVSIVLKFCIAYVAFFVQHLAKKWLGHVRLWSYAIKDIQPLTDFSRKSCFQSHNLLPLTGMETICMIYIRRWPQLWQCILTFQRYLNHWPWMTPYIPIVANLAVWGGFLEALRPNMWLFFTNTH